MECKCFGNTCGLCFLPWKTAQLVGLSLWECPLWSKACGLLESEDFCSQLIYWPPFSWRASWCYNMADTKTVLFALCWDIFYLKVKKHLLLGHAWLEDIDYVCLKYMSNFDQSHCYNHFNMSSTRPSVDCARLAENFVNQSPIYVQRNNLCWFISLKLTRF